MITDKIKVVIKKIIRQLAKKNMEEENKCPKCEHKHEEEDGSCSCGCPKQ